MNLKGKPIDEIAQALREAMADLNTVDPDTVLNLMNLVGSYNTLDQSFFDSPLVWVSSLEEFLDLKIALKYEIREFATLVNRYLLSCIKYAAKTEFTFLDHVRTVPPLIDIILKNSTFLQLSAIAAKGVNIDTKDSFLIENANVYVTAISYNTANAFRLMDQFIND